MERIGQHVIVFLPWNSIELEAQQQILNTARMPFVFKHVAVMPDCHYGKGATVGTVLATTGAVIPAAVGVDIGCGMIAVRTPLKRADIRDPRAVRAGIERRIPMSAGKNNTTLSRVGVGAGQRRWSGWRRKRAPILTSTTRTGGWRSGRSAAATISSSWPRTPTASCGSLFIPARAASATASATTTSKSRRISVRKERIALPDRDLAYLTEDHPAFAAYLRDLQWAQQFALLNRDEMMDRVLAEVSVAVHGVDGHEREIEVQRINSHHNFTQQEEHFGARVWVTRKGAIEANAHNWAMIPGSMGTRSYIVSGKAHSLSFCSAPHGAGRRYSRTKARALFSMEDLGRAMEGIEYRQSKVLLDEIPGAYKDIDKVMEHAKDLVEVRHVLKQFVNVKGD